MDDSTVVKKPLPNRLFFFKTKSEGNLLQQQVDRKAIFRSPLMRRNADIENDEISLLQKQNTVESIRSRSQKYWSEEAGHCEHLWNNMPVQSNECYIGERECLKTGERRVCASCDIIMHASCIPLLQKVQFLCKPTFRDTDLSCRHPQMLHHWVHRWKQEGKCAACNKAFQQKFLVRDREVIAISCSWCKQAYHNKQSCFNLGMLEERCTMGIFKDIVVPPTWINKTSRVSMKKHGTIKRKRKSTMKDRPFIVRPLGTASESPMCPLLIIVNPKSGGTKGSKILSSLYGYLNPRQIFDINTFRGPKYALETYRRAAHRMRVLVCGGDGTIGWVLSTLDSLKWPTYPPLGILPLGTGNDLARTLGWGGAYGDENIGELLLSAAEDSVVTYLDRWQLKVTSNSAAEWEETAVESAETVVRRLPLHVMNNYFSIGADAAVALQFHQSRSNNPDIFNSRFKNRLMYGGIGTVDLFKRTWKDLVDYITLECDGVDLTQQMRDSKFHCLLFLNIPRYAGGTSPWGPSTSSSTSGSDNKLYSNKPFTPISFNDGKVEVLGFTAATLAAIQVGGRGERIAQGSHIRIVTSKPIPCQVDGEPCRLAPSVITLSYHSKVPMLQKINRTRHKMSENSEIGSESCGESDIFINTTEPKTQFTALLFRMPVMALSRSNYNRQKMRPKSLYETAQDLCVVDVDSEMDLDTVRQRIDELVAGNLKTQASPWYFVDVTNDERAYRVAFSEEKSLSICDVANTDECIMLAHDGLNENSTDQFLMDVNSPMPIRKSTKKKAVMRIVLSSENEGTIL